MRSGAPPFQRVSRNLFMTTPDDTRATSAPVWGRSRNRALRRATSFRDPSALGHRGSCYRVVTLNRCPGAPQVFETSCAGTASKVTLKAAAARAAEATTARALDCYFYRLPFGRQALQQLPQQAAANSGQLAPASRAARPPRCHSRLSPRRRLEPRRAPASRRRGRSLTLSQLVVVLVA